MAWINGGGGGANGVVTPRSKGEVMMKQTKYKLWQHSDGDWCCASNKSPRSFSKECTAEEAMRKHDEWLNGLADFRAAFDAHWNGTCDKSACEYCERGTATKFL
jgi:hypothetical protein